MPHRTQAPRKAGNWKVSSMVRARSGFPIDVLTTENLLGMSFDDVVRPDLVPGVPAWIGDSAAPAGGG